MSNYGIDYGRGQSNVDFQTGIRYGVISQHRLDPEALDDFQPDYSGPVCPDCGADVTNGFSDYVCTDCERVYSSEDCYDEEPVGWDYEGNGYSLSMDSDGDVWV